MGEPTTTRDELREAAKRQAEQLRNWFGGDAACIPEVAERLAVLDYVPALIDDAASMARLAESLAVRCHAQSDLLSRRAEK